MSQCPLCHQENNCTANTDCWCMNRKIPQALLERVPAHSKNKQCICQRCVDQYHQALKQASQ